MKIRQRSGWRSKATQLPEEVQCFALESLGCPSPDGIINSDVLLEVKCPFLKPGETVRELLEKRNYDVKMVEGVPQLQENGPVVIFMQVQLAMLCAGLRACKLLIWSASQQVVLDVPFSEDFCSNPVARFKTFYFKYVLPYVAVEHEEAV